jgi:hypothetical protein
MGVGREQLLLVIGLMFGFVLAHVVDYETVQSILQGTIVSGGIYLRGNYTLPEMTGISSNRQYSAKNGAYEYSTLNNGGTLRASDNATVRDNLKPRSGFCRRLPQGATATMLWKQQSKRIIQVTRTYIAGKVKNIEDASYPSWLGRFFAFMHTRFLRLGYKHPPLPSALKRVLEIVDAAMQKKEGSRPLNVVVVGGSIAQGRRFL